jgi:hypothetical protein
MTIYRYGWIAWVWRVLALSGIGGAGLFLGLAVRSGPWWLALAGVVLGTPAVVLPWLVAARIDRRSEEEIVVTNLFFFPRRIERPRIGHPRLRRTAHGSLPTVAAPRAWIPVRGGLPVYLDLYATIPEPAAFRSFFDIPRKWIR